VPQKAFMAVRNLKNDRARECVGVASLRASNWMGKSCE
jgi:hypothetical protein